MKQYRTREERIKNAQGKKRGGCIEVFRMVTDFTAADLGFALDYEPERDAVLGMTIGEFMERTGCEKIYAMVAGEEQCIRDEDDVKAVITEQNLSGNFTYFRRLGSISRVIQSVFKFVTPKNVISSHGEAL